MTSALIARRRVIMQSLRLVWDAAPGWMVAGWCIALVQAGLGLGGLYLTKLLVDAVGALAKSPQRGGVSLTSALVLVSGLAAVALAGSLLHWLTALVNEAQAQCVSDHVQELIQRKSIELDLAYYENAEYHDTLHRAQQEAPYRPVAIVNGIAQAAQGGLILVGLALLLAATQWGLALALLVPALPAMFLRMRYARRVHAWQRQSSAQQRLAAYLHLLVTAAAAAKEIRLFDLGSLFVGRFRDLRRRLRCEQLSMSGRHCLMNLCLSAAAGLVAFGAYAFIAYRALRGEITVGALVLYYQAFHRGQGALGDFFSSLAGLYENSLFLTYLRDLLALNPRFSPVTRAESARAAIGQGIVFDKVGFCYPGSARKALHDISLTINPGEHLALVGPNGSGKTTLVKLLCRLYAPTEGRITLDGVDLQDFDEAALRRMMSVVFQDFIRYHASARENIWFGDSVLAADDPKIAVAARAAEVDRLIAELPHGYDTILSNWFEGGEDLSAGQWQRIAIARAFVRQAPLVILDEPTSALDAFSEHEVLSTLRGLTRNRTSVIVSHRFSTVRDADRICVLEDGYLRELGAHNELMARRGAYAQMFTLQAGAYFPSQKESVCG